MNVVEIVKCIELLEEFVWYNATDFLNYATKNAEELVEASFTTEGMVFSYITKEGQIVLDAISLNDLQKFVDSYA